MPSRRSHTNSHHGCSQCKAKKVKCDEGKPACGRCIKTKTACKYNYILAQKSRHELKQLHPLSPPQPTLVPFLETPLGFFDLDTPKPLQSPSLPAPFGLEDGGELLYHHYINITSKSLFETSSLESFKKWDDSIRQQSSFHEFVLHGMLTFAAIHLSTLHSQQDIRESYTTIAFKYQNTALAKFRTAVGDLSAQNCEAALGYSGILVMSEFAMHVALAQSDSPPVKSIADLHRLITLFHGAAVLYQIGWMKSLDTNLSPHIRAKLIHGQTQEILVPEAEASLDLLETSQIAQIHDDPRRQLYIGVAAKLRKTLRRMAAHPDTANSAFMWPGMISSEYMNRVQQRDPIALILLAHWGVCLHNLGSQWWAKDWGQSTVRLISQSIGPEFQHYLHWPMVQVCPSENR